jgi:arylsulfatase A-like enzyme
MKPQIFLFSLYASSLVFAANPASAKGSGEASKPNILWISAEDHGPHLGCYGDAYATTPNLDAFAKHAYRYTKASSNVPVCAPARTTIISGMYPPSTGSQHMRSRVPAPDWLKFYPVYLQEAGYYTSNNSKEDYNLVSENKGWDESSTKAHWKNCPEGKPFFSIFNYTKTHESQIRNDNPNPKHDPAKAPLPPYHPDRIEVRKDWAQYYDRLTEADNFFAAKMKELEEAGLADDTIVWYWADHGSGMPRSKRYAGWSGLHVPLIVHFPDKWKHLAPKGYAEGGSSDRLVGFIDFPATLLSLAGVTIPDYYHGHAFAGEQQTRDPQYSFGFRGRMDERPDSSRTITDGRYIYIRNNYTHIPHGQYVLYQQRTPTTAVWNQMFKDGELNEVQSLFWKPHPREELYDLENDYHSINNLARSEDHQRIKGKLSKALDDHLVKTADLGFIPEPILQQYAKMGQGISPVDAARAMLKNAPDFGVSILKERDLGNELPARLKHPYAPVRYWALMQLLSANNPPVYAYNEHLIVTALDDSEPIVAVAAAECLGSLTSRQAHKDRAVETLLKYAEFPGNELFLTIHTLNALEHLKDRGIELPDTARNLTQMHPEIPKTFDYYRPQLIERL